MREPTDLEQKQYQKLREIFADCLTAEEKPEIVELGKQVFPQERVKVEVRSP